MITGGNRDDLGSSAALILRFKLWRSLSPYRTEGGHHKISILSLSMQVATAAKSLQSCPTLCDPIDGSPPGSPVPRILQARTLEWVAVTFSNAWKWKWSRSVVSDPQRPHGLQPIRLLRPWDFPGRSTGVGCYCLLLYAGYLVAKLRPGILPKKRVCLYWTINQKFSFVLVGGVGFDFFQAFININ